MPVLILDPTLEQRIRAERDDPNVNRRDEVWEGVLVVPPLANNEHQRVVMRLAAALSGVIDWTRGDQALPGCNVSDRDQDWTHNYREPDLAVYLAGNKAKDGGTHWVGGPDLAVEVTSPGEDPRQKLDFYAKVNTREVLIVDRDPWLLELYQLRGGKLVSAGKSDATNPAVLASGVLPLTFQVQPGNPRPTILVRQTPAGQTWTA
jgi:Uma2 family endonuclease